VLCVCVCVLVRERERDLIIIQKLIKHLQVLEKREKGKDCRAVLSSVSPPSDPEAGAGLAFATVRQADGVVLNAGWQLSCLIMGWKKKIRTHTMCPTHIQK